jgi:uncharacterized protein (DUF2164 family)
MENSLNDDLAALGFSISDTAPEGIVDNPTTDDLKQIFGEPAIDVTVASEPAPAPEPTPEPVQQSVSQEPASAGSSFDNSTNDVSDEEIESVVLEFLSERLGRSINSIEELSGASKDVQRQIDERVSVIADFVEKTGRSPEDWFRYQALNPSELDDLSAIRLKMASEYEGLNSEEVNLLVESQYKLDEDMYSEDEVRLSKLKLKIDADRARKDIEAVRSNYMLPTPKEQKQEIDEPLFDEGWRKALFSEVDQFESIEFELGPESKFNFGISDQYKSELKQKNSNLETFFDQYVGQDGTWNYEMLNAHRAVIDNIDEIVKNIYNQGLSDGQRKLVEKAANVDATSPKPSNVPANDAVLEQLRAALGQVDNSLRFKL